MQYLFARFTYLKNLFFQLSLQMSHNFFKILHLNNPPGAGRSVLCNRYHLPSLLKGATGKFKSFIIGGS